MSSHTEAASVYPPLPQRPLKNTLCLFDVDGTLSLARRSASAEMLACLSALRHKCAIGFVGGSNLVKQQEQLGTPSINVTSLFDFCFAENGLTAYRLGELLDGQSFVGWLGEDKYKRLVNYCLRYMSEVDCPVKRGTFIEFRYCCFLLFFSFSFSFSGSKFGPSVFTLVVSVLLSLFLSPSVLVFIFHIRLLGKWEEVPAENQPTNLIEINAIRPQSRNGMINISPVGRNASTDERNDYEKYDKQHQIREKFVAALRNEFPDLGLTYSIGGQISFDVFPTGWDKTYCLRHVEHEQELSGVEYTTIHFFGDKAFKGGNDWEIYDDPRTVGHAVKDPEDTMRMLKEMFGV